MHNICQNIWYPILIILLFVKIGTADIAMRYAVQKNVNLLNAHAKHWHRYCNMMLYQCFKGNVLYTNVKFTRLQLIRCSNIFLKYRMRVDNTPFKTYPFLIPNKYEHHSKKIVFKQVRITRVSGNISIYVLHEHEFLYNYYFETDQLLRINITVYTLYSYGGFQNCDLQFILFATEIGNLSKEVIFCYHLSTYNFYSVSNDLQMSFVAYLQLEYIFNFSYSVIDKNMLYTDLKLNGNVKKALERENILPFPTYNFKTALIFSFFFKTRKINTIFIENENLPPFIFAIMYDGPGFLAPVNELKNNMKTISSSSFQCILQFMVYINSSLSTIYSLSHRDKPLSIQKSLVVRYNDTFLLTLTSHLYRTNTKIILINTIPIYQIMGTLKHVDYTGFYDPSCLFGGFVVGEYSNEIYDEFFKVCDSTGAKSRSFYSQKSSLILLFYWYKEYSKLNISVILSQTTCKSVLFDPCLFRRECYEGFNQCDNYLRNITSNSGVSYTEITPRSLKIYLNNSHCAIIQFATHDIVLPTFFNHITSKCYVHLFSTPLGTAITKINGIFNKMPTKAPEKKYSRDESLRITKWQLCTQSSKTFCVKDDLGFNMPWAEYRYVNPNDISTFKIDIHPSNYELITDAILNFRQFTKSWVNFVLEKLKTDTKMAFNKMGRTLNTVNANVSLQYTPNIRAFKCFVTLQVNNISQQYMDNTFLHVEFRQVILSNPTSNLLYSAGRISGK